MLHRLARLGFIAMLAPLVAFGAPQERLHSWWAARGGRDH